jgi:hypothetical protein
MIVVFSHPDGFGKMVIKGNVNAFDIRKVGRDIAIANRYDTILHIFGVDEFDVGDEVEMLKQDSTDEAVEIAAGNQPKFFLVRHPRPPEILPITGQDSL